MNNYTAIVDYLMASAPPGRFTLLGLSDDTRRLCDRLENDLGALWTVPLGSWPTIDELRHYAEQKHYDVVLVPPVLHKHKNWYEYLEAIINVADIAVFEVETDPPLGERVYARGLENELLKVGEPLAPGVIVVNRKLLRGEEAQAAIVQEILTGFKVSVRPEHFHVSDEALEGIARGVVEALCYHGYKLVYDPAITVANLNQIIEANPVPEVIERRADFDDDGYQPERLT